MRVIQRIKCWAKMGKSPLARFVWVSARIMRTWCCPVIPFIHIPLYALHQFIKTVIVGFLRIFYWTPLFKTRLAKPAPNLYLFSGMPQLLGSLEITFGKYCRLSGVTTLIGRQGPEQAELRTGDRCHISWQTTIAVGRKVILGNDVYISSGVFLAGFSGHPLNPEARVAALPDTDDQVGDIILEDKVWLGTRVIVKAGVRIGEGTVVAAGSVVTHDLPARVLAAGVPAKVIRALPDLPPGYVIPAPPPDATSSANSSANTHTTFASAPEDPPCSRH